MEKNQSAENPEFDLRSFAEDTDFMQNLTMAQIKYPEIATEIREFKRLTERSTELADKIDDLESEQERVEERVQENAEKIRSHLYNL